MLVRREERENKKKRFGNYISLLLGIREYAFFCVYLCIAEQIGLFAIFCTLYIKLAKRKKETTKKKNTSLHAPTDVKFLGSVTDGS